ncbi:uncharacterized protein ISCGN_016722 [Ixodes scapularis]
MSYVLVEFLLDKTQPVVSSDDVRDFSGVVEDDRVYQVYWAGDARTKGSFYDAKVLYMAAFSVDFASNKVTRDCPRARMLGQSREPEQRPQLTVPVYTGYNDAKSFADFLGPWGNPGVKTSTGRAAGQEDVPLFRLGRVVRPGKHVDLFFVDWPGGPISLEWLEPPVQRHGDRSGASTQPQQQQKRQMVLTPPPPPPLPPLPPQPVPAEVAAADGGSVETTDEHEDRPVSSKRAALDPERPAPEPSGGRYERLKKRVESIERSLDERFARQTEQINEMFSEVNNSVAQLAEQLTQALATLTARMDDVEVRLPPGTGRPIRATGKPRKRGNIQQFVRSREKKPYVILLQETNAPVQLAGYKAAAGTSEGQRKRRGRAVAAGRRERRAPLSSPAPPPPPPPAAAVLVRLNVTVAQRELQGVKVPHVFVELIPRSGQGWFVLNVYSKPSLQHRFGELFRRARAVAGDGPLLIAGDFNAPHAAWGYGRETPKGKRLWEDSQDQGLEFIVNPADPTRRGNSACVDTLPDLAFVANVAAAQWQNAQEDLGSDHSLIEIRIDTGQHGRRSSSDGDGNRKARGRRLRIVEWDAFCKTRKERERGDGPITNIDVWTETLRRDVDAATREVPPEANLEVIDSRLLHIWGAKRALLDRWRRQRDNRTLGRRIAKLDRDIEEHVFQVCGAQWEETCNERRLN